MLEQMFCLVIINWYFLVVINWYFFTPTLFSLSI